jgi:hypothetical protein
LGHNWSGQNTTYTGFNSAVHTGSGYAKVSLETAAKLHPATPYVELITGKEITSTRKLTFWEQVRNTLAVGLPFLGTVKYIPPLLPAQEAAQIKRVTNILSNHRNDGHLVVAMEEWFGKLMSNGKGGFWDHGREFSEAVQGLRNAVERLGRAGTPAGKAARQQAIEALQKIEDAIKGAGI